jgi:mannitol-1-/sugar-/sorbitol-6-phosphatase
VKPSEIEGRAFAAFLFDMDGTILSSVAAAERVWTRWAERHGLDVAAFLPTIHGVRAIDTIGRLGLPGVDAAREAAELTLAEIADVDGIKPIAGAVAFLLSLPADRWAIVTSSPRELAKARLAAAGIAAPLVLVTAEDVIRGKPYPDGFQLAAKKLGCDVRNCLIFEDAPAGIQAAEATGATVMVVSATHAHPMVTPHAAMASFDDLRLSVQEAGLQLVDRLEVEKA